jgi:hypothetical protein
MELGAWRIAKNSLPLMLFEQSLGRTFPSWSDPDLNFGLELFFGNEDDALSIRFFENHHGAGGPERRYQSPIVGCHVILKEIDQGVDLHTPPQQQDASPGVRGMMNKRLPPIHLEF